MKKSKVLLIAFLSIFMILSTGCAKHGTYSDYRSNWNKNVKQLIENKRTTLPENALKVSEGDKGKLISNINKEYLTTFVTETGTKNSLCVITDKNDNILSINLNAVIDCQNGGNIQSDFTYAMTTTGIAIMSMDEKDSEQALSNVLVPPNTVMHLDKRLGTTRTYTDKAGNLYELKITGGNAWYYYGLISGINDVHFNLKILPSKGIKKLDEASYALLSSINKVDESDRFKIYKADVTCTEGSNAGLTDTIYIKIFNDGFVCYSYNNREWHHIDFQKKYWATELAKLVGNEIGINVNLFK